MGRLEGIIEKAIDNYRVYRKIFTPFILALPIIAYTCLVASEIPEIIITFHKKRRAAEVGAEIIYERTSKVYAEGINNSATIIYPRGYGIRQEHVGFGRTFFPLIPYFIAYTFGFYFYYLYRKSQKNSFRMEYNTKEKAGNLVSRLSKSLAFGAFAYLGGMCLNEYIRMELVAISAISVWFSTEIKQRKKYIERMAAFAQTKEDFFDTFYLIREASELSLRAKNALESGKKEDCCRILYRQAKVVRELKQRDIDFEDIPTPFGNLRHFKQRKLARKSSNSTEDMKLIAMTPEYLEEVKQRDLTEIINRNKEMEIEIRLFDYETTVDNESRIEKGITIYNRLKELGKITKLGNRTSSVVAIAKCGILGNTYVIKEDSPRNISLEAEQTAAVRDGFRKDCESDIIISEIAQVFPAGVLSKEDHYARLMIAFEDGETLHNYLLRVGWRDARAVLIRHGKANLRSTRYGLSSEEEDRLGKTLKDLKNNRWISNNTRQVLEDEIEHCFEITDDIPQFYDRDGNPGNSLVQMDKTVLIDFPSRKKSLPLYCLVKQLEHSGAIPYNNDGMQLRREVVDESLNSVGLLTNYAFAAYLGVCVTKFVSYTSFAIDKEGGEDTAVAYKNGAIFGLLAILQDFRRFYSQNALNGFDRMRKALQTEPLLKPTS